MKTALLALRARRGAHTGAAGHHDHGAHKH